MVIVCLRVMASMSTDLLTPSLFDSEYMTSQGTRYDAFILYGFGRIITFFDALT